MLPRATENAVAGHIWPAGRYLPTPVLDNKLKNHHSCRKNFVASSTKERSLPERNDVCFLLHCSELHDFTIFNPCRGFPFR